MKKKLAFLFLFLLLKNLFAEFSSIGIPDSSDIRKDLVEVWFEASYDELSDKNAEIRANEAGQKFRIFVEKSESKYAIVVAAGKLADVNVYSAKGVNTIQEYVYPGTLPGTFILIKDKKTNEPICIRYYFTAESDVYLQLSPSGKTSVVDLIIYDYYAAKGVPTGVPFSSLYAMSFDEIISVTKNSFPWNYVLIDNSLYVGIHCMINEILSKIPDIVYLENAMYDENNKLIHVITGKEIDLENPEDSKIYLSNAGSVKWVMDGLVYSAIGTKLKRGPLVESTVSVYDVGYQGNLSENNSLYFSLDWVRNIASGVISVYTGKKYVYPNSGVDVTINPFASSVSDSGTKNTNNFIENTGYSAKLLKPLLYVLAATEPDSVYLGAIREVSTNIIPEVKVFNKSAIFFPYFNSNNLFECKVFFNGKMLDLEDFLMIFENDFVYFTRVRSSEKFTLDY